MDKREQFAVTVRSQRPFRQILTKGTVFNPAFPEYGYDVVCLWDTGASTCCITESLYKALNLQFESKTRITGVLTSAERPVGIVSLLLCVNGVSVPVVAGVISDSIKAPKLVVVGMDLINQGELNLSSADGQYLFSFRMPPKEVRDYVSESRETGENIPTDLYCEFDEGVTLDSK